MNGATGASTWGNGIQIFGAKNLAVRDNILDLATPVQLIDRRCTAVKYFYNQTPGSSLIRGNLQTGTSPSFVYLPYNELATEAEEAFILGFLKRA